MRLRSHPIQGKSDHMSSVSHVPTQSGTFLWSDGCERLTPYNSSMTHAIRTEALMRTYKRSKKAAKKDPTGSTDFVALAGVDLEVQTGELFGLLGPNGAGKTTLIKILTTLLAPSSGRAWVDGLDVIEQARQIRPLINMVSGGESCGYGVLNVRETLWLFAQIYGVSHADAKSRIEKMLSIVGLDEKADTRISHLSTGQRQKLNFCRGFITDPKILFLDEPTLGLDVNAARSIRSFVKEWLKERPDRTMLLTTHYMSEADELCDRLAIIDQGKVLACDTPANLKKRVQKFTLFEFTITPGSGEALHLDRIPGVQQSTEAVNDQSILLKLSLTEDAVIPAVVQRIIETGSRLMNLNKVEPTLEDVFIELVGRGLT
jgi:ABC-2 type transport system ATP-binding protein